MGSAVSYVIGPTEERRNELINAFMEKDISIARCLEIGDSLTWAERYSLYFIHYTWKTVCQYRFTEEGKMEIKNVRYPKKKDEKMIEIVSNFIELETNVCSDFMDGDVDMIIPMIILKNIINMDSYEDIVNHARNNKKLSEEFHLTLNKLLTSNEFL